MSYKVRVWVNVRSQKVPIGHQNSKILVWACGTCFLGTFARRVQKLKPFCNLTPKKPTIEKGQVNPRVTLGQIAKLVFLNQKDMFLNHFDLRIPKMSFYYCSMSRNAPKHGWKKWPHQQIRFWARCLPKKTYQPEIQHVICPGIVLQHNVRFLQILQILDFEKCYIKISVFNFSGVKKTFFGKSEIVVWKNR